MASDNKNSNDPDDLEAMAPEDNFDDLDDGDYVIGEDADFDTPEAEEVFEDTLAAGDAEKINAPSRKRTSSDDSGNSRNGAKKLALPALVLVCAVGVGVYIIMNPGLLGGASKLPVQTNSISSAQQIADMPVAPPAQSADTEMPPQPTGLEQVEETKAIPPEWSASDAPAQAGATAPAEEFPQPVAPVPQDITEIVGQPVPPPANTEAAVPSIPVSLPDAAVPAPVPTADFPVVADAPMPPPAAEEFPEIKAQADNSATPVPQAAAAAAEEGIVGRGATQVPAQAVAADQPPAVAVPEADDVFYDSRMTVPTGALAKDVGPRKVDPVMEPASSFVVVSKNHDAQSQESLLVSANRALKLGRYDAAMEMYDALYAKNKKDPAILMGRAVAYQKAGRTDTAIQIYDELLAIDKDNGNALLNMLGLLRTQYPEVALRRLMNLHEQYPGNASIVAQMGLIEADQGHPDEALRYLGMAASIEPNNAQHYFNMAIVADRKGDKTNAIKWYEQALETDAVYGDGRSIAREQIYDRLAALRRG